jgi:hypothetical protein
MFIQSGAACQLGITYREPPTVKPWAANRELQTANGCEPQTANCELRTAHNREPRTVNP